MINKSQSAHRCSWTSCVHVSYCASISDVWLQQKIALTVSLTGIDPFGVICKVDCPVFNPLVKGGLVMFIIKHSVLPLYSPHIIGSVNFKAVSIMSILDIMGEVCCPEMDDDWCVVHDVVMQVLEVFLFVTQFFNSVH